MIIAKIYDLTVEHLGPVSTEADLRAVKAACRAYQRAFDGCSEAEAIDAILVPNDWWPIVATWAPAEAAASEAAASASAGDEALGPSAQSAATSGVWDEADAVYVLPDGRAFVYTDDPHHEGVSWRDGFGRPILVPVWVEAPPGGDPDEEMGR